MKKGVRPEIEPVLVAELIFWSVAQYCRISKNLKKWVYCFPLVLRIFSLQMCCNSTVCFATRVIKFKFCCNSVISQPLPNCKTQFSQKEEVGSYDKIALNQRFLANQIQCIGVRKRLLNVRNDRPDYYKIAGKNI